MGGERRGTCRHVRTFSPPFPTHGALSLTHFGRDWQGIGEDRITHKLSPQGDRKGPHPAPHHSRPYHETSLCDTPLVVIVRAGVVWSGVGTLAVALAVGLRLSPPVASPSWARGASGGRPAGGSALIAVRLRCGIGTFAVALGG